MPNLKNNFVSHLLTEPQTIFSIVCNIGKYNLLHKEQFRKEFTVLTNKSNII